MSRDTLRTLIDSASAPYRSAGRTAWHFARGKLGGDPVFSQILRLGPLSGRDRILDLGCGQGLLAAWLQSASDLYEAGQWPADWPAPPRPTRYLGIDRSGTAIARARSVLPPSARFRQGDLRTVPFPQADAVLLIDVLHYMPHADQESVLLRSLGCLPPGGLLLLRVGNAAGGLAFRCGYWVDLMVAHCRGHHLRRLYCRSLDDWRRLLTELGYTCEPGLPGPGRSWGGRLANALLVARAGSVP
ncbi:MAG: class I SAM-dependent methyltransferase [Chromatiaceae bacterium]|jgi:SAM-dependent methyltransferase